MKTNFFSSVAVLALAAVCISGCASLPAGHRAPKKLLVVSVTTGFRHASIPALGKMLSQLATNSGEFTVDFVSQPPGHSPTGFPKKLKDNATPEEKTAFDSAEAKWTESLKAELQKLSPENLKKYDGVVFVSTTGYQPLPLPDAAGFFKWLKAGHAFIGLHAATDIHGWPEYTEMIGGEFAHHGAQTNVICLNQDKKNPATAGLPAEWAVSLEEIYQFKSYDPAKVHDLLIMDKHPEHQEQRGHFAVSWCKDYGAGKVFYTSLGHREDVIDADPNLKDRKNSVAIAKAYQMHILGGIEWALGIKR
jgi:type 1 glutamine amidotransferase